MEQRQENTAENRKQSLRKDILKKRNALSTEEQKEKSRRIMQRLFEWEGYRKAENILCYVSWRSEVQTQELIELALAQGRKVYCPKVHVHNSEGDMKTVQENRMDFYRIMDPDELRPGFQGIREPQETAEGFFAGEENRGNTLMILPGAVFDQDSFHRIGYGGGYYDRYLAECGRLIEAGLLHTVAVAYELQLAKNLPVQEHDMRVEAIITEKRTYVR